MPKVTQPGSWGSGDSNSVYLSAKSQFLSLPRISKLMRLHTQTFKTVDINIFFQSLAVGMIRNYNHSTSFFKFLKNYIYIYV